MASASTTPISYLPQKQTMLERQASRLSEHLSRIQSTDAYPPESEGPRATGESDGPGASVEKSGGLVPIDIEHVPVDDDPREWSPRKKWGVLLVMSFAVLGPTMAASIYNPVVNDVRSELGASDAQIGMSLSLYILFQGCTPLFWAPVSEPIYLLSYAIYLAALVIGSRAQSMPVLIAMRVLQAFGSGPALAIGAGSLADMYEQHERGAKLGMFYGVPMFGPALAPIIGGGLGQAFGWRSVFYFLSCYAFIMECFFAITPDSWRRERSRLYQKAITEATVRAEQTNKKDIRRKAKLASHQPGGLDTIPATPSETPGATPMGSRRGSDDANVLGQTGDRTLVDVTLEEGKGEEGKIVKVTMWQRLIGLRGRGRTVSAERKAKIKPSARDLNPLPSMMTIMKRPTNILIVTSSSLSFGAQYTIVYTASLLLGEAPYNYNPLKIGLAILSFGIGNISASVIGGKYSDMVLRRLKKKNGGVGVSEMRLKATVVMMPVLIASFLAYAWTAQEKVHIAGIVVCLFFCGFSQLWIYSSSLAYLVDSNPGISSSAVSCNSMLRGICGCVMSQIAQPIRNAIGDGGLFTLFAGVLALACGCNLLLIVKGEQWRSPGHKFTWFRKSSGKKAEEEESRVDIKH
ncbi:hypothetical protein I350_02768 [Cryptococcus amylolentus CBS 6273]|uniref:Major facilitator superfamily (MFS) profile domain-containing protein n=1 Tax=Cryptococcus amylolentus CBS 6273 TaxID=1296118 RepID=A0A1E3K7I5_9TREE|nr:hypothetical protein I350_02768 [Cryptococcus amylolentus CBS 6273]